MLTYLKKLRQVNKRMTNIILCGGSGTRLWPISRSLMPKQFVKLFDEKSLFQLTVERNQSICNQQMVVSNSEQYFLAVDQLDELDISVESQFLLEPVGRNTAPAIALACFALEAEEIVLVTPSDHLVKDIQAYKKVLHEAETMAKTGALVTFGITPEYPETGYGYIEAVENDVKAFHEKPELSVAKKYLEAGNFYWNSGMFCFKAGLFLQELQTYAPKMYQSALKAYKNAKHDEMIRIGHDDMAAIEEDSIDYAVMEKSQKVKVVPADIAWSDLGSFDALSQELPKDDEGNSLDNNLISVNAKNNFVLSENRCIAITDVDDLIVVDTVDALLITKSGASQHVKSVVKEIKKRGLDLHHIHTTAHRPWGTYTILEESDAYKIKRIVVKPGKRLSLQKHHHRSEHWIVVSGSAIVAIDGVETLVSPNESTYIPIGAKHRLTNPGKIDLVMIEAQVGEYLGEDDIVRFDDDYKRN